MNLDRFKSVYVISAKAEKYVYYYSNRPIKTVFPIFLSVRTDVTATPFMALTYYESALALIGHPLYIGNNYASS